MQPGEIGGRKALGFQPVAPRAPAFSASRGRRYKRLGLLLVKAISMAASSMHPAETNPANSPSSRTTNRLPVLRGADPHVDSTVTKVTPRP
jgi:hypothetical protein